MQYCMLSRRMHSNSAKEQHYSYQSINNPIFPTPLPIQSGTTYGPPSQLKMMNNTLKKHTQSNPKETEKKRKHKKNKKSLVVQTLSSLTSEAQPNQQPWSIS
jgi:hypothetical protein